MKILALETSAKSVSCAVVEDGAPLASGETTAPLFTVVRFAAEMDNLYQNSTATIDVTVEAVQQANNGATALEAAGWPEA